MEFWNNPVEFARVLGILVPLVVALITKRYADSAVKSLTLLVLSAASGAVAYLVGANGGWDWGGFFNAWFNAALAGIAAYYGVLKPICLAPAIADATSSFGIGDPGPNNEGGYVRRVHWVWILVFVVLLIVVIYAVT